jgi:hypothetical protein
MLRSPVSAGVIGALFASIWLRTHPWCRRRRRRGPAQPRLIIPFVPVIEAWLRNDLTMKATVIHERLVAEHGFTGNY